MGIKTSLDERFAGICRNMPESNNTSSYVHFHLETTWHESTSDQMLHIQKVAGQNNKKCRATATNKSVLGTDLVDILASNEFET